MPRSLRRWLFIWVGFYVGLCLALWAFQHKLIWIPGTITTPDPSSRGWSFEEVSLEATDGPRLAAWFLPVPDARGVVLVSHGNAGTIAHRLDLAGAFRAMDVAVLLYDYRGFGDSEGAPSEEGTYLDAEAAYDFLLERGFAPEEILLYGKSLGGAVAIELALRRPSAALIVESTFTSLPDIAAELYPWLPVRWLARVKYASLEKIERIARPLMVLHSPNDEVIPFEHGERLYERAFQPKRWVETGGGHNGGGFTRRADWRREVAAFVDAVLPSR